MDKPYQKLWVPHWKYYAVDPKLRGKCDYGVLYHSSSPATMNNDRFAAKTQKEFERYRDLIALEERRKEELDRGRRTEELIKIMQRIEGALEAGIQSDAVEKHSGNLPVVIREAIKSRWPFVIFNEDTYQWSFDHCFGQYNDGETDNNQS